ncbi:stage II sporulation protein M [Cohnella abietis]|uniref:Stage II sporulation protein M n=1 Tax=Cohnella abietis TaxID=2507935 RepID=A0A3T1DD22_9BACL|nr:stage II sporulation protein M [Cohnella abietis]BBI35993.1 hypothetical protein KCTCHS21_53920 [Cohnella abietis]
MFSRQGLLQTWNEIRPYFIFSVILFFAAVVIGATPNAPTEYLSQQIKSLQSLADDINKASNPEFKAFLLITANNVSNTLLVMVLGIVAGIMPIVMLISNGLVMGYLLSEIADKGHNVWLLIVKGILPHGIFELSAIFLACAFGMRFGITLFKGVLGSLLGKTKPWHPFVRTATGSVPALIVIIVFLVIAAIIESTITYWLVN